MIITNRWGLPDPLVLAVSADPYNAGICDISVTRLISPPQLQTLLERHGTTLTEDVLDRLWALYGQVGHLIAERAGNANEEAKKRYAFERRFFADVPGTGWRLSGQIDLYDRKDNVIQDYKFVGEYAIMRALEGDKPEWEQQLNILRWLMLTEDKILAQKLEIIAFARDLTSRTKVPAARISVPVWDINFTAEWIADRVRLHQAARKTPDALLPHCTDADRWRNAKTGQYTRCERFCSVKDVCHQYRPLDVQNKKKET